LAGALLFDWAGLSLEVLGSGGRRVCGGAGCDGLLRREECDSLLGGDGLERFVA
jgi:hypothetical protein